MVEETKKEEEAPETPEEETTPEKEEKPEKETPETPEEEDKEPEKKPEKKEEEEAGKEPEGKPEGEEPEGEPEGTKRTPRLMESWRHDIAMKKSEAEKEELRGQVAELSKKLENKSEPDREKAIRSFAEKAGWDEDMTNEWLKISDLGVIRLEKEIAELKTTISKEREQRVWDEEDKLFEQDFTKSVASLLQADGIKTEDIPRVKKMLKTYAFTKEYASTPLKVIYKGLDIFRQFSEKGKKSAEPGRTGLRAQEGEVNIKDMSAKEFNDFIDEEKKKAGKFQIRRDGQAIS